ncbi:hypothetical protein D046_2651A, partial [Vibrio parahaemolyticus V-223/04]
MDSDNVI